MPLSPPAATARSAAGDLAFFVAAAACRRRLPLPPAAPRPLRRAEASRLPPPPPPDLFRYAGRFLLFVMRFPAAIISPPLATPPLPLFQRMPLRFTALMFDDLPPPITPICLPAAATPPQTRRHAAVADGLRRDDARFCFSSCHAAADKHYRCDDAAEQATRLCRAMPPSAMSTFAAPLP